MIDHFTPSTIGRVIVSLLRNTDALKSWVQILGIAGVVTTVVSFWYGTYYEPSIRVPTINVMTTLQKGGQREDLEQVLGTVTVKNPTQGRVQVLGGTINVYGVSIRRTHADERTFQRDLRTYADNANRGGRKGNADRNAEVAHDTTLYSAVPLVSGWNLEPGEENSETFVVHVPPEGSEFDVLELDVSILAGRASDKLGTVSVNYQVDPDQQYLSESMCINLVKGRRPFESTSGRNSIQAFGVAESDTQFQLAMWPTPGASRLQQAAPTATPNANAAPTPEAAALGASNQCD
jgi:hypothetical protein